MNWIKYLNSEIESLQDKIYGACSEVLAETEQYTDRMLAVYKEEEYVKGQESLELGSSSRKTFLEALHQHIKAFKEVLSVQLALIDEEINRINNKCLTLARSNNDALLVTRRFRLIRIRMINQIRTFLELQIDSLFDEANNIFQNKKAIYHYHQLPTKDESDLGLKVLETAEEVFKKLYKVDRIFSYKEMVKLAESNGYVYKWSSGSHRIFEHNKTNKIIVIPSHELGYGLSCKIQKQIYVNAA